MPAPQGRIPGAGTGPSSLQAFCSRTRAPCPPGGGLWEELTRESGPLGAGWADEEARLARTLCLQKGEWPGAQKGRTGGLGGAGGGESSEVWIRPGAKGHLGTPGWRLLHALNSGDPPRGPHDGYTLCKERLTGNGPS